MSTYNPNYPYYYGGNLFNSQQQTQPIPTVGYNQPQRQEIIRVHGEEGARAFVLPPNSSVILMDETDNVVWAKVADGAGYASLQGFRLTPIEEKKSAPVVDVTPEYATKADLESIKTKVDSLWEELNGKSNS